MKDKNLPADHQGINDPGNDEDEMVDEDGNPVDLSTEEDEDIDN